MVDSFYSLWHNTIICCNYKDCDISGICTTHTHSCKCFMSRCIQECNLLTVYIYCVSTDMLCDTACFLICYVSLTDSIQKRSLTMVNVSHYADNRRSLNHIFFFFFILFQQLFDNVYLNFLLADDIIINCDILSSFIGNLLIYRYDLSLHEELLNDSGWLDLHLISQFLDCQSLR